MRITDSHISLTISSSLTAIVPAASLDGKRFQLEQYFEEVKAAASESEEDLHADDDEGTGGLGKVAKFKLRDTKKDKTILEGAKAKIEIEKIQIEQGNIILIAKLA